MKKKEILEEAPKHPPKKRRVMEDEGQTLDIWLAVWANDPELSPSERRRAQEERDRRKQKDPSKVVAILRTNHGMTPQQSAVVKERLKDATERRWFITNFGRTTYQEAVKGSDLVLACPKETSKPSSYPDWSLWAAIRYARNRNETEVTVVMPNGDILNLEEAGV